MSIPLLRGRSDADAENEFDIAVQMTPEHVSSEIQENRNGQKN